jgi:hypothetical protein
MATVNLGNIKFNWKGTYNAGTAYAIDDVVSYNGSSYVCIQASTNNLPTVTAYWDIMTQKGTDADLLNIASTAQGDLYYNNGSAIARLGAGTSGQFLKTQGTGANPVWGTVSSDLVKLYDQDLSGASTYTISNVFSSTYNHYEIHIERFTSHSEGGSIYMRLVNNSGSVKSNNEYYFGSNQITRSSGSASQGQNTGWGATEWWLSNSRTDANHGGYAKCDIAEVGIEGYPRMTTQSICFDGSSQIRSNASGNLYNASLTTTGFYIFTNGGNNISMTIRVYGKK